MTVFLLSGCATVEKDAVNNIDQDSRTQATEITEDTMTGYLLHIDTKTRVVSLNISKWVNRGKTEVNDMMHSKKITYNENTIFQDKHGSVVHPGDFKIGEKLAVLPTTDAESSSDETASVADKVIQLTMSKEEKLERFLASSDNFHTVVLYEEGTTPPYDEMDFEKHVPESFSGGISWVPYIEGLAVDYKEELGLEKLPMILVFDRNGLVFQTETLEQLKL
ncbi:hypothetical protein [Paenibacillus sp. Soil522]|uniref:hypothetical protein n=1 Tax=Paenibacillus sp. Soil522 TaxID=1736388 RepID=UPI0006F79AE0|nr:hypothetical protein [Paenibacillus sp. Soil522]KRE21306.1 hypothetical protein ASG81_29410 [Paenibacillus sp. Soil522]